METFGKAVNLESLRENPPAAVPQASAVFSLNVLERRVVHHRLGQQLLQPAVFIHQYYRTSIRLADLPTLRSRQACHCPRGTTSSR